MFPRWYANIQKLNYPNYDFIVVDNTNNLSYVSKLRREGYKHIYHQSRGGNSRIAIARASEFIRRYAVENDYDYIMFIETDLLPPKNIIQRLMGYKKPVTGAIYEIGLHNSTESPRKPLLYRPEEAIDGTIHLKILTPKEGYSMMNKGLLQTPAMGLGCCLIHSNIFKKYTFKYTSTGKQHTDSLFYYELWRDKVPVWVDTDIIIYHENQNWAVVKDW